MFDTVPPTRHPRYPFLISSHLLHWQHSGEEWNQIQASQRFCKASHLSIMWFKLFWWVRVWCIGKKKEKKSSDHQTSCHLLTLNPLSITCRLYEIGLWPQKSSFWVQNEIRRQTESTRPLSDESLPANTLDTWDSGAVSHFIMAQMVIRVRFVGGDQGL